MPRHRFISVYTVMCWIYFSTIVWKHIPLSRYWIQWTQKESVPQVYLEYDWPVDAGVKQRLVDERTFFISDIHISSVADAASTQNIKHVTRHGTTCLQTKASFVRNLSVFSRIDVNIFFPYNISVSVYSSTVALVHYANKRTISFIDLIGLLLKFFIVLHSSVHRL